MNTGKSEEHWKNSGSKLFKKLHDETYSVAFQHGRRIERARLSKYGWLMINPEKQADYERALVSPCVGCQHHSDESETGCLKDPKKCEAMKKHMIAQEVQQWFA